LPPDQISNPFDFCIPFFIMLPFFKDAPAAESHFMRPFLVFAWIGLDKIPKAIEHSQYWNWPSTSLLGGFVPVPTVCAPQNPPQEL
jgi:hypothetical protein